MIIENTISKIKAGKNIIYSDRELTELHALLRNHCEAVHLRYPTPLKQQLVKILSSISEHDKKRVQNMTIAEIEGYIIDESRINRIVILFEHFETITSRVIQIFIELNRHENISFVASFSRTKKFSTEAYKFFKMFEWVNKDEYKKKYGTEEINIAYPMYYLASLIIFLVFIRFSVPLMKDATWQISIIISGVWIAFLLFRTFTYIGE